MPPTRPPMMPPSRPPVNPLATGATAIALILGLVIGLPIAVVLVITLWTPAWRFADVLTLAIDRAGALLGFAALGCVFAGALLVLRRLYISGTHAANEARKVRVIKMQHGQSILIDDLPEVTRTTLQPAMAAHYAVELQEARREHPNLHSYVNSPRIAHAPPQPAEVVERPAPAPIIPTFAELLDRGLIGPGRPLILSFNAETAQPIMGDWKSLYSCGIGALQGAGKSWLAAFLLAQSVLQGDRLIVADLHYGNEESLGSRIEALAPAFMCDIASTPDAILSALKLASSKLQQRKQGKGGDWNILIAVDEWTSLLRTKVGDVLPAYLEDISEQGRKFHVNALLAAQGWTKDTAGVVRNRLTSHYVLRQRPDEARYQLGLPAAQLPADIRTLPDAQGYLLDVRGNLVKIAVPRMTSQDLARVATMIPRSGSVAGQPFGFVSASRPLPITPSAAASEAETKRPRSGNEAASEAASIAAQRPRSRVAISPEAARVYAAWKAGRDVTELAKEANGGSTSGDGYKQKLRQINTFLREATGDD